MDLTTESTIVTPGNHPMNLTQGAALAIFAGIGFIAGLLLDEVAWGLIVGAGVGVLIEAFSLSRRNTP